MRDTVYLLVFDGFADWQAALALCEIRRPGDWPVQAVGFSMAPVRSMGGLSVQPDLALAQLDPARDAGVISASHLGSVEFAREIIDTLGLYDAADRDDWYRLFKHAQLPAWCLGEPALAA